MAKLTRFFNSFKYAFCGIMALFGNERNAKFHLFSAVVVIMAGIVLKISNIEWCLIMLCIGGVFAAEGFNTAIEKLCDKVSPQIDPLIRVAKDVAAASVLLFVIACVIVGLIVFVPKLGLLQ